MHVGFTGTQSGMTERQRSTLIRLLAGMRGIEALHHGDCVGADAQAHDIARLYLIPVHLHPPENTDRRAHCSGAAQEFPPLPYLERNRAITHTCGVLIAAPKHLREVLRSGTWATVRYARALGRRIYIIWPSGRVVREGREIFEEAV